MGIGAVKSAALVAVLLAACDLQPITGPVPTGTWGGPQGNLLVYADSATLDLPCAAGRIPTPLVADSAGRFDVAGFYAVQAGPISIDGAHWQTARYTGQRTDDHIQMTITVTFQSQPDPLHEPVVTDMVIGPLKFRRGLVEQFPRCV